MKNDFADGFSDRLKALAFKNCPPHSDLSPAQISIISKLAGYRFELLSGPRRLTIFHSDNQHGLTHGLWLVWHVRTDGWNLIFFPTLQIKGLTGDYDEKIIDQMLTRLATFLSVLGYQTEIQIPLDEEVIILPEELQKNNTDITVMFISEFQAKYESLYGYLKQKMLPPR